MNHTTGAALPGVGAHLAGRLFAGRLDHQLAVGVIPGSGTALAVHAERLRSDRERHAIARTLRRALDEARARHAPGLSAIGAHRHNVSASADTIHAVALRLHAPRPVRAMGMARLRRILSDPQGPMYHGGTGDLDGRLNAALAAL
ncbi:hypothetical protein H7J88_01040 [Mycolicibacterium flavescens]|uniref:Uncharacterized protein n=1 Tax=Mycolicibacterium flavescens TaxID=1776 RepID=A0A1E3RNR7_MYCFV|nr:hypothetical protein [Mycolicibacterium flavescens]MCV7278229.1 hypothetical protein [Mycolicibacterium flavescens]ODQ91491.1 hypothetical protein BHQ18_05205 [Mycolicibacterium flavescens]